VGLFSESNIPSCFSFQITWCVAFGLRVGHKNHRDRHLEASYQQARVIWDKNFEDVAGELSVIQIAQTLYTSSTKRLLDRATIKKGNLDARARE
jgi:hypothetical protein